jgi:hypothetical protein
MWPWKPLTRESTVCDSCSWPAVSKIQVTIAPIVIQSAKVSFAALIFIQSEKFIWQLPWLSYSQPGDSFSDCLIDSQAWGIATPDYLTQNIVWKLLWMSDSQPRSGTNALVVRESAKFRWQLLWMSDSRKKSGDSCSEISDHETRLGYSCSECQTFQGKLTAALIVRQSDKVSWKLLWFWYIQKSSDDSCSNCQTIIQDSWQLLYLIDSQPRSGEAALIVQQSDKVMCRGGLTQLKCEHIC